ncbi:hypothetical protein ABTX77_31140 [Streptomyces sp. NPDC097704]|uniref:hypothetical protein n=1 Tax=Streptomyces sp. NPDC097704 TaxID=3157101 RepID=UPI0033306981
MRIPLSVAGVLFLLYPALRPWEDESTTSGAAAAMGSTAWIVTHLCAMIGFILVAIALLSINRVAAIVFWIGAGLTLPYYGAEVFGLHAMANQSNVLDLAEDVRYNPFAMTMFGLGLLSMAAGAILVAARMRTAPAILFAAGFGLFLPQFFGPPALRIAHGVLLAAACVWLAWDTKRVQPAPELYEGTGIQAVHPGQ